MIEETVMLGTSGVTAAHVVTVARGGAGVGLAPESVEAMAAARAQVEQLAASPEPVYGISTGFGALEDTHIAEERRTQLQHAVVRSHAASMGDPVEAEVVRALMFLRLRTLASGRTGARPVVAERLVALLNAQVTPVVREYGSLGCSGDLAPLAHCALLLMGEGEAALPDGRVVTGAEALAEAGIASLELGAKEGLALINGTDGMLGMLLLAIEDLSALLTVADVAAAISVEALLGTDQVFREELHTPLRPHPGQAASAENMYQVMADSPIVASHKDDDPRVQDAYSMRCAPQVVGAARDTLAHAQQVAERELAASIDNPVVLPDGSVRSNGNFHGAPVGYVMDFLAIAAADVSSLSERRTDRLLDPARSMGLPAFLGDDPGVDSGLMIAQYTQAALVSENKRLAAPASVDSIPSSAMQEDHVSMGWHAGRKLRTLVANLRRVLAVELVAGTRALDLRAPLDPGPAGAAVRDRMRPVVPGPGADRFLAPELQAADDLVASGAIVEAARQAVGPLS